MGGAPLTSPSSWWGRRDKTQRRNRDEHAHTHTYHPHELLSLNHQEKLRKEKTHGFKVQNIWFLLGVFNFIRAPSPSRTTQQFSIRLAYRGDKASTREKRHTQMYNHHAFRNRALEGLLTQPQVVLEASSGRALIRSAGLQCAGDRETHSTPSSAKSSCLSPKAHGRRAFPVPPAQATFRVWLLSELLPLHACNRWRPGSVSSQSPKPCNKRTADSTSWPEPAQATVLLARAAVLLQTQAERQQIPSLTGCSKLSLRPVSGAARGGTSLLHKQVSRREG